MQCLHIWITIWLFAISVNNLVASPVDILNVDNKNKLSDLNTAESNRDDAVISERDNEVGYLRKEDEKGADAYQHFESFHDKDGDAYGYEKHEAYGKSNKGESLNDEKDKDEGSHYNYVQELGDKPKYQKYHGSVDDPGKNKQSNYHYSYNSDDDDEAKPNHSSSYKEEIKKDDSSEKDDDEDEEDESDNEADKDGSDEEKSTNFSYKIISDDYEEEDANGDVNSKGSGNGSGYNFGHGDRNTDVTYNTKKSDYIASDDHHDDDDDDDDDDGEGSEEEDEDEGKAGYKDQKIQNDLGKDKNTKSYSTYTTYNSQDGDNDDVIADDGDDKEIPKHAIRYQNSHPKNDYRQTSEEKDDRDENDDGGESDEKLENAHEDVELHQHENDDVDIHQPATPVEPRPTKPVVLLKEHRSGYVVQNDLPKTVQTQVVIHPSKPILLVQEHNAGYKTKEGGGEHSSDDSGKSNGGGGGGEDKGSDDASGDDGKGKSESLVLEQLLKPKNVAEENENGAYKVNINYGKEQGIPKSSGKKYKGKRKGSLKKKKQIIKPHKYEVEEYIDNEKATKQPIIAGKESSPQHHRDSADYSNGQQFIYASEADSDAYYW